MRILNLYAGIGGNRKLWTDCEVTAVEIREDIAMIYKDYFPDDEVVIDDAHEYLLNNYERFDFIWSSYPCQENGRPNFWASKTVNNRKKYYPGLGLYQEIIFLKYWFRGKWAVENVVPYYEEILVPPTKKIGRHLFWSNFKITDDYSVREADIHKGNGNEWHKLHGFDLSNYKINSRKDQIYRNCVYPETGLHILNCAIKKSPEQIKIFNYFEQRTER